MMLNTLVPVKPSPGNILAILRDQHRHQCESDPGSDPDIDLTFESTVQDWRIACDLLEWKQLALALNEHWVVQIPLSEWKAVLTPPKKRNLHDVCALLSRYIEVKTVVPPTLFGRTCAAAGVFFAIRELLARDGADVSNLTPSSPLADYSRDHFRTIAGPISQLAPGLLPAIDIENPEYDRASFALVVSFIGLFGSLLVIKWAPFLWMLFAVGTALCWMWTWHVATYTKPARVSFGNLRSIRDVCQTLAPGIRSQ